MLQDSGTDDDHRGGSSNYSDDEIAPPPAPVAATAAANANTTPPRQQQQQQAVSESDEATSDDADNTDHDDDDNDDDDDDGDFEVEVVGPKPTHLTTAHPHGARSVGFRDIDASATAVATPSYGGGAAGGGNTPLSKAGRPALLTVTVGHPPGVGLPALQPAPASAAPSSTLEVMLDGSEVEDDDEDDKLDYDEIVTMAVASKGKLLHEEVTRLHQQRARLSKAGERVPPLRVIAHSSLDGPRRCYRAEELRAIKARMEAPDYAYVVQLSHNVAAVAARDAVAKPNFRQLPRVSAPSSGHGGGHHRAPRPNKNPLDGRDRQELEELRARFRAAHHNEPPVVLNSDGSVAPTTADASILRERDASPTRWRQPQPQPQPQQQQQGAGSSSPVSVHQPPVRSSSARETAAASQRRSASLATPEESSSATSASSAKPKRGQSVSFRSTLATTIAAAMAAHQPTPAGSTSPPPAPTTVASPSVVVGATATTGAAAARPSAWGTPVPRPTTSFTVEEGQDSRKVVVVPVVTPSPQSQQQQQASPARGTTSTLSANAQSWTDIVARQQRQAVEIAKALGAGKAIASAPAQAPAANPASVTSAAPATPPVPSSAAASQPATSSDASTPPTRPAAATAKPVPVASTVWANAPPEVRKSVSPDQPEPSNTKAAGDANSHTTPTKAKQVVEQTPSPSKLPAKAAAPVATAWGPVPKPAAELVVSLDEVLEKVTKQQQPSGAAAAAGAAGGNSPPSGAGSTTMLSLPRGPRGFSLGPQPRIAVSISAPPAAAPTPKAAASGTSAATVPSKGSTGSVWAKPAAPPATVVRTALDDALEAAAQREAMKAAAAARAAAAKAAAPPKATPSASNTTTVQKTVFGTPLAWKVANPPPTGTTLNPNAAPIQVPLPNATSSFRSTTAAQQSTVAPSARPTSNLSPHAAQYVAPATASSSSPQSSLTSSLSTLPTSVSGSQTAAAVGASAASEPPAYAAATSDSYAAAGWVQDPNSGCYFDPTTGAWMDPAMNVAGPPYASHHFHHQSHHHHPRSFGGRGGMGRRGGGPYNSATYGAFNANAMAAATDGAATAAGEAAAGDVGSAVAPGTAAAAANMGGYVSGTTGRASLHPQAYMNREASSLIRQAQQHNQAHRTDTYWADSRGRPLPVTELDAKHYASPVGPHYPFSNTRVSLHNTQEEYRTLSNANELPCPPLKPIEVDGTTNLVSTRPSFAGRRVMLFYSTIAELAKHYPDLSKAGESKHPIAMEMTKLYSEGGTPANSTKTVAKVATVQAEKAEIRIALRMSDVCRVQRYPQWAVIENYAKESERPIPPYLTPPVVAKTAAELGPNREWEQSLSRWRHAVEHINQDNVRIAFNNSSPIEPTVRRAPPTKRIISSVGGAIPPSALAPPRRDDSDDDDERRAALLAASAQDDETERKEGASSAAVAPKRSVELRCDDDDDRGDDERNGPSDDLASAAA